MSPCITRLGASTRLRKPRRLPLRPPARSGADGYGAAGGQRHGPGRRRPRVNDRNLDGRNFLCLSVGREWGEDRGGDGGDVHPCFERCRTHADIHSDGDRIFRHGGVSDQRSDGPDRGGQFPFRILHPVAVAFVALHTYYMSPTGRTAIMEPAPRRPGRRRPRASCAAMSSSRRRESIRELQYGGRLQLPIDVRGDRRNRRRLFCHPLLCGGRICRSCAVNRRPERTYLRRLTLISNNWAVEGWLVSEGYEYSRSSASVSRSMTAVRRNKICRFHQRHCLSQRQWFWHQRAWTCRGWSRLSRICRKYRPELGWSLRRRDINRRDGLDRY